MNDQPIIPSDDVVSPPTRGPFPSGIRLGLNGGLEADDLMRRALGYSEQLPPQPEGPEEDMPSTGGEVIVFAFKGKKTGDLEFTIQPGAVELGPDTVIESGSITGYAITQTIPSGQSAWYAWVNVDVSDGAESAEMLFGASITALTSEERKHIRQKRVLQIALVDNKITTVKNLQCGNIDIPRL